MGYTRYTRVYPIEDYGVTITSFMDKCCMRDCLLCCNSNTNRHTESSYTASLASLQQTVLPKAGNTLIIHCGRLFQSTLNAVKRPSFSYEHAITVKFAGKDAEDYGAPRREFLRYEICMCICPFVAALSTK